MKLALSKLGLVLLTANLFACSAPENTSENAPGETPAQTLSAPTPVFHPQGNPKTLADWGILASNGQALRLAENSFTYDLRSALFSDYALKLRSVHIPEGTATKLDTDNDRIIFPVGTIITKSFYYPKGTRHGEVLKPVSEPDIIKGQLDISDIRLVETRLLVRREAGWDALPYVWNDDQTEARLSRTGDLQSLKMIEGETTTDFAYVVPNVNQCAGCHATNHTTKKIVPIGPRLRHLTSTDNMRLPSLPESYQQNVAWDDPSAKLDDRARAYLDINCSHCHNVVGPADTSGLHLEPKTPVGPNLGLCKTPIAAGTGTGNRKHGIVPGKPDESIFIYRMASTNPAVMMPELGRSLSHDEGVALIKNWIESLKGSCSG